MIWLLMRYASNIAALTAGDSASGSTDYTATFLSIGQY